MKIPLILSLIILVSGCVGIGSHKYHALDSSETHVDCGLLLNEPRMGGMFSLSGIGNSKHIIKNGHSLLACSKASGEDALYLFGPFIPFIPAFGMGSDRLPEPGSLGCRRPARLSIPPTSLLASGDTASTYKPAIQICHRLP